MITRWRSPAGPVGAGKPGHSSPAETSTQLAGASRYGVHGAFVSGLQCTYECATLTTWLYILSADNPPIIGVLASNRCGARFRPMSKVGVAQLGRALDCGSSGRGFKSHRSPSTTVNRRDRAASRNVAPSESKTRTGPLAQLVEQRTLNPSVEGSIPSRLIAGCLVKLVDTLALGASTLTGVRVRVSGQPLQDTRAERASESLGISSDES